MGLIFGLLLFVILFKSTEWAVYEWDLLGIVQEEFDFMVGLMMSVTFFGMWFCILIVVCTMELYSGENWVTAYRIGFSGDYCDQNDYFAVSKWSEYDWDIQNLLAAKGLGVHYQTQIPENHQY